jgi:hypothetical protein
VLFHPLTASVLAGDIKAGARKNRPGFFLAEPPAAAASSKHPLQAAQEGLRADGSRGSPLVNSTVAPLHTRSRTPSPVSLPRNSTPASSRAAVGASENSKGCA